MRHSIVNNLRKHGLKKLMLTALVTGYVASPCFLSEYSQPLHSEEQIWWYFNPCLSAAKITIWKNTHRIYIYSTYFFPLLFFL